MLIFLLYTGIVFVALFAALLWYMRRENAKAGKPDKQAMLVLTAALFAGLLSLVMLFFLLIVLGAANVTASALDLKFHANALIFVSMLYLAYWVTFDNIASALAPDSIVGKLYVALTRVLAFFLIGYVSKLGEATSIMLAVGVATVLYALDVLFLYQKSTNKA